MGVLDGRIEKIAGNPRHFDQEITNNIKSYKSWQHKKSESQKTHSST
jgi:hypothetical protein